MRSLGKYYILLSLFVSVLYSKDLWVDYAHDYASQQVLNLAEYSDKTVFRWLDGNESTCQVSCERTKKKNVDSFFQSSKYLEETDDTFIRVRFDTELQSREKDDLKVKFSVQFPFSRCKKHFKFFMENLSSNKKAEISKNKEKIKKPEVGFSYLGSDDFKLKSKYSVGVSEFFPFLRARYHRPWNIGNWTIDPVQTFKYSKKYRFEEKTDIYFDIHPAPNNMFRFSAHRKTKEEYKGMDYEFTFQYYFSGKKDMGLRLSQSFSGNTEYIKLNKNRYKGVNDYRTSFSYRATILRKWFYYEISPSVNFYEKNEYRANYALRFFLDFYFGIQN